MASNSNCGRNPPIWSENLSFEDWRNEVDLWLVVTELAKEKQAPQLILYSLSGQKREVAKELNLQQLGSNNGVNLLMDKLKENFGKDSTDSSFEAYVQFEKLKRPKEQKITEYIICFENAYQKIARLDMKLPDSVRACKLLHSANLERNKRQMALTTCKDLTIVDMKNALRRLFSDTIIQEQKKSEMKEEPAFKATGIS